MSANAGSWERVVDGLDNPRGIELGPDDGLYVSNLGFGFPPGSGQIVRIEV